MVRRFYIAGGNNVGDPAVNTRTITDSYFADKEVTGVFKEGFRYYLPVTEWSVNDTNGDPGDTVTILEPSPTFDPNEVIIIEVGPKKKGVTCADEETPDPYLPDIIKCVVARVNYFFENREDDPFSVFYGKGLYEQVGKDRFFEQEENYLMIWLVMPFTEDSPQDNTYFADATCKLLIAIKTDSNYTQIQREDENFHPRLIPVYKRFIYELQNEVKLRNQDRTDHTRRLLPYWGGGDINAGGQPNLWKQNVDGIEINNLKLKIGFSENCVFTSNF